jgi:hypothetical protein
VTLRYCPGAAHPHARNETAIALQSGRSDYVWGEQTSDGVRFVAPVGVREGRGGGPDFRGPLVHGKPGERFLYVCWLRVEGGHRRSFGRLKLFLTPVVRKTWSQSGITRADLRSATLTATVSGVDASGGPACGSCRVDWAAE